MNELKNVFSDIEGKNGNNTSIIVLFILLQQPIILKYLGR